MITPGLLELEFPVFPPGMRPPGPPQLSAEQFIEWLEEARALQSKDAFEAWLADPASLPKGEPFVWREIENVA
jgi:hypothetical protein